jgi:hypothetical protein
MPQRFYPKVIAAAQAVYDIANKQVIPKRDTYSEVVGFWATLFPNAPLVLFESTVIERLQKISRAIASKPKKVKQGVNLPKL